MWKSFKKKTFEAEGVRGKVGKRERNGKKSAHFLRESINPQYLVLFNGCVAQGLETTEFTNLIGSNQY